MYPADDNQFEDCIITGVQADETGWSISCDGLLFGVQKDSPVAPVEGMAARFYGRGFGYRVRGLFLDGQKVFYRTEEEDREYHQIQVYGADATEWLKRWDEGRIVWSIEMGGLGPSYEQCIHITCAEIVRVLLDKKYDPDTWVDDEAWKKDREEIESLVVENPTVQALGLSGGQWHAALNLATMLYRKGPRHLMNDERVKDRHIQVRRTFPGACAA